MVDLEKTYHDEWRLAEAGANCFVLLHLVVFMVFIIQHPFSAVKGASGFFQSDFFAIRRRKMINAPKCSLFIDRF
jgi:hypothetical protein